MLRDNAKYDVLPSDVCISCKGRCCKLYPGLYWPDDFSTVDSLIAALREEQACVDYWEGSIEDENKQTHNDIYFVRGRTKVDYDYVVASRGGQCKHLGENGCQLPRSIRPSGCKCVVPQANHCCTAPLTKKEQVQLWISHQQIIKDALTVLGTR
jgi:hypothetical protein